MTTASYVGFVAVIRNLSDLSRALVFVRKNGDPGLPIRQNPTLHAANGSKVTYIVRPIQLDASVVRMTLKTVSDRLWYSNSGFNVDVDSYSLSPSMRMPQGR